MSQLPIEEHGIIGNLETCALIDHEGCIDWCCFPHVESPSIFARILDDEIGGHFSLQPTVDADTEQRYIEQTNVLQTIFQTDGGRMTVTDFMPIPAQHADDHVSHQTIYRQVSCTEGSVEVDGSFKPRFEYARTIPDLDGTQQGMVAVGDTENIVLSSSVDWEIQETAAVASFTVDPSDPQWFVLGYNHDPSDHQTSHHAVLEQTIDYWQDWAHQCANLSTCIFGTRWHEWAVRSGLLLKLLIHQETGAICAAPTTSLPEEIGGSRNWDYRFNWLRDAAFTVQALHRLGHVTEAKEFFQWCLTRCHSTDPADIQPLYGLHLRLATLPYSS